MSSKKNANTRAAAAANNAASAPAISTPTTSPCSAPTVGPWGPLLVHLQRKDISLLNVYTTMFV